MENEEKVTVLEGTPEEKAAAEAPAEAASEAPAEAAAEKPDGAAAESGAAKNTAAEAPAGTEPAQEAPAESMADYAEEIDKSFGHSYEWNKLKEYMDNKTSLKVKIEDTTKGGVLTHLEGMRAFIPASKLSLGYIEESELASYVGREIDVRVITAEQKGEKLVLSARDILRDQEKEAKKKRIQEMKVGTVLDGKVESIQNYGAFIDLGDGISGLLHVSQISSKRIDHPGAVLKKDQEVKVKIIAIKDGKLSLSMKALDDKADAASEEAADDLPREYKSEGTVGTSLADLLKKAGF